MLRMTCICGIIPPMLNQQITRPMLNSSHTRRSRSTHAPGVSKIAIGQSQLQPIHNRMPVILDEAGAADWMNLRESDPLSLVPSGAGTR